VAKKRITKSRVLVQLAAIWAIAALITSCGGHSKSSKPSAPHGVRLTENDLPDVLMPGVFSGNVSAVRTGNTVVVNTGWVNYVPGDQGIGSPSSDVGICRATVTDLVATPGVTVMVMGGANNDTTLAWNVNGPCHDLGNHN
jgi:hypothetical protein